jgi:MFS family permease
MHKPSLLGWVVWLLGSLFFFTEYFIRVSPNVLGDIFITEFNSNATTIGLLSAYFYYAYVVMQIPVGLLVERLGSKFALSIAAIIFGCATFGFSFIDTIYQGYYVRFVMGLVGSFAFVGTLKLISDYFPPKYFAVLAGITQGLGLLGAFVGAAPLADLFLLVGWRLSFVWLGVWFILLGITMLYVIKDKSSTVVIIKGQLWQDLLFILKSKQIWLNCLFIGLSYAPTEVFLEQWGTLFIEFNYQLSLNSAALQIGFMSLGMVVGCPLLGFISNKVNSRIKVMRVSSILSLLFIMFIVYGKALNLHLGLYLDAIVLFMYGIVASGLSPSYALATEIHPKKATGLVLGITNMATVVLGAILIPLVGKLLDCLSITAGMGSLQGMSKYTLADFEVVFCVLPLCFVCCIVLTFFIKETYRSE